eukprot:1192880-Prorocentrum_minimum.AAC.1
MKGRMRRQQLNYPRTCIYPSQVRSTTTKLLAPPCTADCSDDHFAGRGVGAVGAQFDAMQSSMRRPVFQELEKKQKEMEAERQRKKREKEVLKQEQNSVLGKGGARPKLSFSLI